MQQTDLPFLLIATENDVNKNASFDLYLIQDMQRLSVVETTLELPQSGKFEDFYLAAGEAEASIIFVQNIEEEQQLFMATFDFLLNGGKLVITQEVDPVSNFWFGGQPHAKYYYNTVKSQDQDFEESKESYLSATFSNTLCQCGIGINNDGADKCNYHISEQSIINMPYSLGYFVGRTTDVQNRLRSGQLISGCDEDIVQAKYFIGESPNLVVRREGIQLRAHAFHTFINYPEQPLLGTLFCGSTNYEEDFVSHEATLLYSFRVSGLLEKTETIEQFKH